ncbi:hypothetical protein [Kitasatospora sp. NPDC091207]
MRSWTVPSSSPSTCHSCCPGCPVGGSSTARSFGSSSVISCSYGLVMA